MEQTTISSQELATGSIAISFHLSNSVMTKCLLLPNRKKSRKMDGRIQAQKNNPPTQEKKI
jgi:hypothetical protein